jgi:hypothetical protein
LILISRLAFVVELVSGGASLTVSKSL